MQEFYNISKTLSDGCRKQKRDRLKHCLMQRVALNAKISFLLPVKQTSVLRKFNQTWVQCDTITLYKLDNSAKRGKHLKAFNSVPLKGDKILMS